MIEVVATVAKEVAKKVSEATIEAAKKEVSELPEKIGEMSVAECLPEKIDLMTNEMMTEGIPDSETFKLPDTILSVAEKSNVPDADESDYPSTYKERIDRTPSEQSDRGEWTGERGESTYIPSDEQMKELLQKYGMEGIEYKDGIPDFSQCSECTVEIDNMTENRYGKDGNFAQCDEKCAEQWNKEGRDGKTDWTARDVQKWRSDNGYSWHERNDMKTCDLIPTEVNDYFGHLGGVAECKKRDTAQNIGGDFDE